MEGQHWFILLTSLLIIIALSSSNYIIVEATSRKSKCKALFVFGDSLSDPGNNLIFKPTFLPYGIDYARGPTGRCCNGKIMVDFIGELLGFPNIPSYVDTINKSADTISGVNYASAGAGILDRTGFHYGLIYPFSAQIKNFNNTLQKLGNRIQKKKTFKRYLAKSIAFVAMGVNDYINNYFLPVAFYNNSLIYNPEQYADHLINVYTGHIMALQSLGLRKFVLGEITPVGCAPNVVGKVVPGACDSTLNNFVKMFNSRLKSLVDSLNSDNRLGGSMFVYGAIYQVFTEIRDNANAYGFNVRDIACCAGNKQGVCLPKSTVCDKRDEYLFWDFAHPTEAVNRILAQRFYNGTSDSISPYNLQRMASM